MGDQMTLAERVWEACGYASLSEAHGILLDMVAAMEQGLTPRQQDCLVGLARDHVGPCETTPVKTRSAEELVAALKLLAGSIERDGREYWIWADDCYVFGPGSSECQCARFKKGLCCCHLMALALTIAGSETAPPTK